MFARMYAIGLLLAVCTAGAEELNAREPAGFGTYVTAHSVPGLLENGGADALALLERNELSFVLLEVYRGGFIVPNDVLEAARDMLQAHGYAVAGGIATVPGGDFGVPQKGPLEWFNFQAGKTQQDLANLMRRVAPLFDTLVVDDFLCTGDVSDESKAAKGDRPWSDYRRDLMVHIAKDVLIGPAKEANPEIDMVVKFPQWYDLFHQYGYDVDRMPELFDVVWVGTETRGRNTQRFGFAQPTMGFVNYRWMKSNAGTKLTTAWFDFGDCDARDFVDQAYQTTLARPYNITLFSYAQLAGAHEGAVALVAERDRIAQLSLAVDDRFDTGVWAYKPPQSSAGGDLYLMDFLGMLGIPLLPTAQFPGEARVLILPAQAAADADIAAKVQAALPHLDALVMTAGFLAASGNDELYGLAGVAPVTVAPLDSSEIVVEGDVQTLAHPLGMETDLTLETAVPVLEGMDENRHVPYLTRHDAGNTRVYVLNTHTYSEKDFRRVGEVLLPPKALGLTVLPAPWADELRRACAHADLPVMSAPASVTLQAVCAGEWFIQNYRDSETPVVLEGTNATTVPGFEQPVTRGENTQTFTMPARSRLWVKVK